jgi:hypothetical protein
VRWNEGSFGPTVHSSVCTQPACLLQKVGNSSESFR